MKSFHRAKILCAATVVSLWLLSSVDAAGPNVVLFYTDDQGTLDANCYGSTDLYTPNMDALAEAGVRFTQFYAHTVCCPSRALVFTGRHPQRSGVTRWMQGDPKGRPGLNMYLDEVTLAESFKAAGYRTGLFGKWHLGAAFTHGPTEQGFDEFFGCRNGFIDNYNHYYLHGQGYHDLYRGTEEVFEEGKYFPDLIVREANQFLSENRENPFFLALCFNIPHYPEQADKKFDERYAALPMPRRSYARVTSTVDDRMGLVLAKLDELQLRDDTIVFFLSDNGHSEEDSRISVDGHASGLPKGSHYGAYGGGGNAGKWRGAKHSFFEGGLRVPAIVSYPKRLPQGVVRDQIATAADIYPTVLELCGIPLPDVKLDGKSLLPIIESPDAPSAHDVLHWQWFDRWAVRQGEWKLIEDSWLRPGSTFLANLAEGEPERTNHAATRPDIVRRLRRTHMDWSREVIPERVGREMEEALTRDGRDPAVVEFWPDLRASVGDAFRGPGVVYFKLWRELRPGKDLVFSRLNNSNRRVYMLGDPEKTNLKLTQTPTRWTVVLPEAFPEGPDRVVVFETEGDPYLPVEPRIIRPGPDGTLTLNAYDAVTHGEKLFYEPQPHKNTLGYWVNVDDWAEWHVEVDHPTEFEVHVLQGCGTRHGGSPVDLLLAGDRLSFAVEETGHFQNFKPRKLGRLKVSQPGRHRLEVRPRKIAYKAVMDLRQVTLVPVTGE